MGTPFDYPLSSRLDENNAIFVLENTFIPWEDVLVYGDVDAANTFFPQTGFWTAPDLINPDDVSRLPQP